MVAKFSTHDEYCNDFTKIFQKIREYNVRACLVGKSTFLKVEPKSETEVEIENCLHLDVIIEIFFIKIRSC